MERLLSSPRRAFPLPKPEAFQMLTQPACLSSPLSSVLLSCIVPCHFYFALFSTVSSCAFQYCLFICSTSQRKITMPTLFPLPSFMGGLIYNQTTLATFSSKCEVRAICYSSRERQLIFSKIDLQWRWCCSCNLYMLHKLTVTEELCQSFLKQKQVSLGS